MLMLVVDCDEELGTAILTALSERCPCVARAKNATDALAYLKAGLEPDLVLVDLYAPETEGLRFLSEVAADPAYGEIPIIAMVGGRSDPHPSRACGALVKPFGSAELFLALADHGRRSETIEIAERGRTGTDPR
jgi:CheY-like chemotaxis protein